MRIIPFTEINGICSIVGWIHCPASETADPDPHQNEANPLRPEVDPRITN
jgi:hypothetical protein